MFSKFREYFKNPHVQNVHLPAHIIGTAAAVWAITNPSWWALVGFLLFNFWFSGLGQSIGFHRYFTHSAFKTNRFWHYAMLIGGTLAGQGSVVFWVALHRIHHSNSDKSVADIHSPKFLGFWHAYMGWIFTLDPLSVKLVKAADVIREPVARFTHRHYDRIMAMYWVLMLTLAYFIESARPFIAGALAAGSWSIHQEALINSVCHDARFGNAPFANRTKDGSRNVWWLHYLTWGQALHNNHHAFPKSANFGVFGERDLGYHVIRLIETRTGVVDKNRTDFLTSAERMNAITEELQNV